MSGLNRLERAVLRAIAHQYPNERAALLAQFDAATPTGRRNTGAGFFTDLAVDPTRAGPVALRSPVGEVWAAIAGYRDPMGFLLFLEDGIAMTIEGHALRDDTARTDFRAVSFVLLGPDGTTLAGAAA